MLKKYKVIFLKLIRLLKKSLKTLGPVSTPALICTDFGESPSGKPRERQYRKKYNCHLIKHAFEKLREKSELAQSILAIVNTIWVSPSKIHCWKFGPHLIVLKLWNSKGWVTESWEHDF